MIELVIAMILWKVSIEVCASWTSDGARNLHNSDQMPPISKGRNAVG